MTNLLKNNAASEVIAKMYLNENLADVHFQFNIDDDVQSVPANKSVLAALSPVFYTMFFGSLKEGNVVKIADVDANAFKEFLQFFYLGEVTLSLENIVTVARLADKYDILEVVKASTTFVKSQLTLDNMCWGYQLGVFLKNIDLIAFCEWKITRSPKEVFATNGFQRCDRSILKRILGLALFCKEINIVEACFTWAKYGCKQSGLDETQVENLKAQLGDCLYSIRFDALTIGEFSAFVMSNDGLFTPDELKDIMFPIGKKGYKPKMFNQNHRRLIWNEEAVLECRRVFESGKYRTFVQSTEIVWFTSNQMILLGELISSYAYNIESIDLQNNAVNVKISELGINSSKKVLYEGSSKTVDEGRLKVVLTNPILIEPNIMYEIVLTVPISNINFYYCIWEPTVELENGLIIQFHRNPAYSSYDTSSYGWIETLVFNRVLN